MKLHWPDNLDDVTVVGCGGTGGYVAEGLCRLLPRKYHLCLIDHDRVEQRNLERQNFFKRDIGKFKSQALAERLCAERAVYYSVEPMVKADTFHLVIGCVDNAAARKAVSDSQKIWWIDAGNGREAGQVLVGNIAEWPPRNYKGPVKAFREGEAHCLPDPALQQPSLLMPSAAPSCAEDDGQGPLINRFMADLVLLFVDRLLGGRLEWMGAYIDLKGTLSTVPAEPETVARMLGVRINSLVGK